MIRLTGEEISLALREQGYTDEVHAELEVVAKAQLKKVVDYLKKRAFVFQPTGEGAVVVIACDWHALLDEVK